MQSTLKITEMEVKTKDQQFLRQSSLEVKSSKRLANWLSIYTAEVTVIQYAFTHYNAPFSHNKDI